LRTKFSFVVIHTLTIASAVAPLVPAAVFSGNPPPRRLVPPVTIVEVRNGSATIQGSRNSGVRQARPGMIFRFGELIIPDRGVVVVIQCNEGKREIRSISGVGDICPDSVSPRYDHAPGQLTPGRLRGGGSF
jgi:hypothetical protein